MAHSQGRCESGGGLAKSPAPVPLTFVALTSLHATAVDVGVPVSGPLRSQSVAARPKGV